MTNLPIARSESQRQRDRNRITDLYLQGWTQQAIANELGISRQTVNKDVKALLGEWKKRREGIQDEFASKYDFIYREAIAAWRKSLLDAETTIQELIDAGEGGTGPGQRLKASTKKEGQSGNPALLAQAQAALKAIREMFGVDAPALVDIPKDSNFEAALKRAYGPSTGNDDPDQNSDQDPQPDP